MGIKSANVYVKKGADRSGWGRNPWTKVVGWSGGGAGVGWWHHSLTPRSQPWAKVPLRWSSEAKERVGILPQDGTGDGFCNEMVKAHVEVDPIEPLDVRLSNERRRKADTSPQRYLAGESSMRKYVLVQEWR